LEEQALWSGLPYEFPSGTTIRLTEYEIENETARELFDDVTFSQHGILQSLEEFKSSYAGSIAGGNERVAERLRRQAASQWAIADYWGVPLRWHVRWDQVENFRSALGQHLSSLIEFVPYRTSH
jgi:hypothetical protein